MSEVPPIQLTQIMGVSPKHHITVRSIPYGLDAATHVELALRIECAKGWEPFGTVTLPSGTVAKYVVVVYFKKLCSGKGCVICLTEPKLKEY